MTNDSDEFTCVVCAEHVTSAMSAECNWCDRRYHLNQRNDIEAKDCGQVWIDEQYLALQFACNNCLTDESDRVLAVPRSIRVTEVRLSGRPTRVRRYKRRS